MKTFDKKLRELFQRGVSNNSFDYLNLCDICVHKKTCPYEWEWDSDKCKFLCDCHEVLKKHGVVNRLLRYGKKYPETTIFEHMLDLLISNAVGGIWILVSSCELCKDYDDCELNNIGCNSCLRLDDKFKE